MARFIALLTLLVFELTSSYPLFARQENQVEGFFPYNACLLIRLNKVGRVKVYKSQRFYDVKFEATIERAFRGSFQRGENIVCSLPFWDMAPKSTEKVLSKLVGTKQVIAFCFMSETYGSYDSLKKAGTPVCNLYLPFEGKVPDEADLAELKAEIKKSDSFPGGTKAAFKRYLESRWTTARINDFCRPENQRNWLSPFSSPWTEGWEGTIHENRSDDLRGKEAFWTAHAFLEQPELYAVRVSEPNTAGWELEFADPSIERWSDDDFLIYRLGKSIERAFFNDWSANLNNRKRNEKLNRLFLNRTNESISKNKGGKTESYRCRLKNGSSFCAVLSPEGDIDEILINNSADPVWNQIYHQTLVNLKRAKTRLHELTTPPYK